MLRVCYTPQVWRSAMCKRWIVITSLMVLVVMGCATNPAARDASIRNAGHIDSVALGNTMNEVLTSMAAEPEMRTKRVQPDGRSQEEWSWVTDYEHDTMTTVFFTDRIVTEIRQAPWAGQFDVDTIATGENLESAGEVRRGKELADSQRKNVDAIEQVITPGLAAAQVPQLLGEPFASSAIVAGRSLSIRHTYRQSSGRTVVVVTEGGKVVAVEAP